MRNKYSYLGLLLVGLLGWFGPAAMAEAQIRIEFEPSAPKVGNTIRFEAIIVPGSGDREWFFGSWEDPDTQLVYEEDQRFEWKFDGTSWDDTQLPGGHDVVTGTVVTYAYSTAGQKIVKLRAWNDRGEWEEVTVTVTVSNEPPVACFTYEPAQPSAGSLITFDAQCSADPDGTIASYAWSINGGAAVVKTEPIHMDTLPESGSFPVQLTVTDNGGLTDTITEWVTVRPEAPVAVFSYSPDNPSVYDTIVFDASASQGEVFAWCKWVFGDGDIVEGSWGDRDIQKPSHRYQNGGVYEVGLWVTDEYGAVGHTSKTVTVTGPAAAFTFSPQNPTTQTPVQFHDQSHDINGQIISWSWAFGDGGFSNDQHPLYTFAVPGTYVVRLTVTGQGSSQRTAQHSTTRTIQVRNALPTARYVFAPDSPKVDEMITFSAEGANDPDGYIVSYEWDFDRDGLTDVTGSTVTYAFSKVGAKMVRLTVTDDRGGQSSVVKVVPVQAEAPLACFTVTPEEPYTGQTVGFNASCSADSDGAIVLYEWDFTGNGKTDATGMSVNESFPSPGVYPVTLKVTDNDGLVGVETRGIPVQVGGTSGDNQPPVGEYTFEPAEGPDVNLHEVVTFKSAGSSDPDGEIVSYEWDFNQDGIYDATSQTVTHIFHTGGAKIVTLRVTDNDGGHGYKSRVVSVEFIRPDAEFDYTPQSPRVGDLVTFDASDSTDRDGTVQFYEWDFTGDGRADATGRTVNRVFDQGGRLGVTLTVTDNDGITGIIARYITVEINNPPTASFTYRPEEPTIADKIEFTNRSEDSDGIILMYLWSFGDNQTSTIQTPSHRYGEPGVYTVTLKVTDNDGAEGVTTETLKVGEAPNTLQADFSFSPERPSIDQDETSTDVTFTDLSDAQEASIVSWVWDFGDGSGTVSERNPVHPYDTVGTYTVSLTVTDSLGREDLESKQITVVKGGGEGVDMMAYPNPASRLATINYFLPEGATGPELWIYGLDGKQILRLDLEADATGFAWDLLDNNANAVSNGLYFCMITAKNDAGRTITSDVFRLLIAR